MYLEEIRPLTDRERRAMEVRLARQPPVSLPTTLTWSLVWLGALAGITKLAVHTVRGREPSGFPLIAAVVLGFGAFVAVYALIALLTGHRHWSRHYSRFRREVVPQLRRVLAEGRVHSKSVTATAVVSIPEFEDEGPAFLFDVGAGQLLLLRGQRYSPTEPEQPWPSSSFELVRSADRELWLGLFCNGTELLPSRVIEPEDRAPGVEWHSGEELLTGTLDETAKRFIRHRS